MLVKKKIIGIVSASVLITICVIIVIVSLTYVPPVTTNDNQNMSNSVSTNSATLYLNSTNSTALSLNSINSTMVSLSSANSTAVKRWLKVSENIEGRVESMYVPVDAYVFTVTYTIDSQNGMITNRTISLNPIFADFYNQIGYFGKSSDTVVVYPLFTQSAYDKNGFYDYYNKKCDSSCLTINIPTKITPVYQTSGSVYTILKLLHYDTVTDVDVDKNPTILDKYKKVIILHNEYVTQREFDAITNHPNVVYLFPNALYAKIQSDYDKNTITLIRGHGYPDSNTTNGFGWKFDNSRYEYDIECNKWEFYAIDNGTMLNCYPTFRVYIDKDLLHSIFSIFSDPS